MADVARARAARAGRAPRRGADAAARRAGGRVRSGAAAAAARAGAAAARLGRRARRAAGAAPSGRRSSPAAARCWPAPGRPCGALGELTGAVLATSAVANGLFAGDPYALGIAGGFSSPRRRPAARRGRRRRRVRRRAEPVDDAPRDADRAGRPRRPGRPRRRRDRRAPAGRRSAWSATRGRPPRRWSPRSTDARAGAPAPPALADEIAARRLARRPVRGRGRAGRLDPRTLTIALDAMLPARAHRGRRLRPLHGLAVDVPARPGRRRLRLPAGLPVRRPRARQRDRRGASRGPTG